MGTSSCCLAMVRAYRIWVVFCSVHARWPASICNGRVGEGAGRAVSRAGLELVHAAVRVLRAGKRCPPTDKRNGK